MDFFDPQPTPLNLDVLSLEDSINTMGGHLRLNEENIQSPISIVGELFEGGVKGNAVIAETLGFESKVVDRSAWMNSEAGWVKTPAWCSNTSTETDSHLENLGVTWASFEHEGEWLVVGVWSDFAVATKTFKKLGTAKACLLHHVLLSQ